MRAGLTAAFLSRSVGSDLVVARLRAGDDDDDDGAKTKPELWIDACRWLAAAR